MTPPKRQAAAQRDEVTVSEGYDNIFEGLGLPDASDRLAKAMIARVIRQRIRANGWTGAKAARALGIQPSDTSDLMRGKLARFSQERLERFLILLDYNVRIVISPKLESEERATISVECALV